jgi:hypothetical protein
MDEEFETDKMRDHEKAIVRMRSITNYVMGIILFAVAALFLFPVPATEKFISKYDPDMIKVFAGVCIIYGIFRIYRGYKKNYFRES